MTDFGKRVGDMSKSTYDTDENGTVDDAEKLQGSSKAETQDHTPKSHTHEEADITDLDHNAQKIKGVTVDDGDKGGGKVLTYNATSENLEYETPSTGGDTIVDRGDPSAYDYALGDLTTDNNWNDLDLSAIVPANAKAVLLSTNISDNAMSSYIKFRKNGNANERNVATCVVLVAGYSWHTNILVFCDANRKIEYRASNVTWTHINLVVCGWFV